VEASTHTAWNTRHGESATVDLTANCTSLSPAGSSAPHATANSQQDSTVLSDQWSTSNTAKVVNLHHLGFNQKSLKTSLVDEHPSLANNKLHVAALARSPAHGVHCRTLNGEL
jgi:hypothetical protein